MESSHNSSVNSLKFLSFSLDYLNPSSGFRITQSQKFPGFWNPPDYLTTGENNPAANRAGKHGQVVIPEVCLKRRTQA